MEEKFDLLVHRVEKEYIYLAILEDRHIDTIIRAFKLPYPAMKKLTEWQMSYVDEGSKNPTYRWEEVDCKNWNDVEFRIETNCDDGPVIEIQKKELR